jgi:mannitol-1-phosphate 5-dehydrogenase
MEGTKKKKAVQFGAGNIGRGFMGQLLWEAGFEITFVDADKQLVTLLNDRGQYLLQLLDAYSKKRRTVVIDGFTPIATDQWDKVATAIKGPTKARPILAKIKTMLDVITQMMLQ